MKFFLSSPTVVLTVLALASAPGLLSVLVRQEQPLVHQEAPEQRWTAGTGAVASLATLSVRGALPAPDPRQKRAPCDPEVGEEEIGGACWIRLSVEKCNERKAFPHNGRCYWRALRPEPLPRDPTSGEGRPLGIADP